MREAERREQEAINYAKNVQNIVAESNTIVEESLQAILTIKSFTTDNLWTLDQLDKLIPELVEAKKHHDKQVEENGSPKKV